MLIKFKKPDPRAGMKVRMDSSRGQHFVDIGHAVRLKESGEEDVPAPTPDAFDAAAFVEPNAADVVESVAGVTDVARLQAVLEAETAGKARKTVIEALETAISKSEAVED
jgi:hypothetical protein